MKSNAFFSLKFKFAYQPKGIRQTILLERIKSGRERQATRNAYVNKFRPKNGGGAKLFFRVPLPTESNNICELPVCLHAFRALFCITRKISQYFRKHEASTLFGPIQHGNCNTRNRYNGSKVKQSENDVIVFLQSNSDTYGEAYATRFIRELCGSGLRKEEEDLVELPSNFSKRKLYRDFCFQRGYKIKGTAKGSYGNTSVYELRPVDPYLWPEGTMPLPVCSYSNFLLIWKEKFPNLKIRNRCEDTCGDCVRFRNTFAKFNAKNAARKLRLAQQALSLSDNDDDQPSDISDSDKDEPNDNGSNSSSSSTDSSADDAFSLGDEDDFPEEVLMEKAYSHTVQAQAQRELAKLRTAEAQATANLEHEKRTYCLIGKCTFLLSHLS